MSVNLCAYCRKHEAGSNAACNSCLAAYTSSGRLQVFTGEVISKVDGPTATQWLAATYPNGADNAPVVTTTTTKKGQDMSSTAASSSSKGNGAKAKQPTKADVKKVVASKPASSQPAKQPKPTKAERDQVKANREAIEQAITTKAKAPTRERGSVPATKTPSKRQVKRQQAARHTPSNGGGTSKPAATEQAATTRKPAAKATTITTEDLLEQIRKIQGELNHLADGIEIFATATFDESVIEQQAKDRALAEIMERLTGRAYAPATPATTRKSASASRQQGMDTASKRYTKTSQAKAGSSANGGMRAGSLMSLALDVLAKAKRPLTVAEIMERVYDQGWESTGATPAATLASKLYMDTKREEPRVVRHETEQGVTWTAA